MKKDNINGLPFLTIIERLMNGDEEIRELYKFEESNNTHSEIIDSDDFLFDSSKISKPDKVSFCYGVRWNFDELCCRKIINKDWKNNIVEYGSTIFIPYMFYQTYLEDVKFIYNTPRERSLIDEAFNMAEPYRNMSKKDFVDNVVITIGDIKYSMCDIKLVSTTFSHGTEIDWFECDYFKMVL